MEYWPAIIFGWPGAILGGALLASGIVFRKFGLSIAGAVIATGFCAYAILIPPPFRWFGVLALTGNYLSAVAIRGQAVVWAAALLIPFAVLAVVLAFAVLAQ